MLTTTSLILFEHQHHQLPELLAGGDPAHRNLHPVADKWSIHDQLAHLASYQPILDSRIGRILNEENPAFERYRADDDPIFHAAQRETEQALFDAIRTGRQPLLELLKSLSDIDTERTAVHPQHGRMKMQAWVDFFLLHEAHHHFAIFRLQRMILPGI